MQQKQQESAYSRLLGIKELDVSPQRAAYQFSITSDLSNRNGVLHGGALMSLVDHCGGTLAFANCPPGKTTVTLETKTNFLRAARVGDTLTAEGTVLHAGGTSVVVQVITRRGDGKEVSASTQTQLFLEWRD